MTLTTYDSFSTRISVAESALMRLKQEGKTPEPELRTIEQDIALMKMQLEKTV